MNVSTRTTKLELSLLNCSGLGSLQKELEQLLKRFVCLQDLQGFGSEI